MVGRGADKQQIKKKTYIDVPVEQLFNNVNLISMIFISSVPIKPIVNLKTSQIILGGVFLAITTWYADLGSGYVVPSACAKSVVDAMVK